MKKAKPRTFAYKNGRTIVDEYGDEWFITSIEPVNPEIFELLNIKDTTDTAKYVVSLCGHQTQTPFVYNYTTIKVGVKDVIYSDKHPSDILGILFFNQLAL